MSQDNDPSLNPDNIDLDGNFVEEIEGKPNESPLYKSREDAFKVLRKTETTNAYDDHKYVKIELPKSGVVGEKFQVKVSRKVPNLQVVISDKINFEIVDKVSAKHLPAQLFGVPFMIEDLKDVDKYDGNWINEYDHLGKKLNALTAGDLLLEVRAYGTAAWHETTVRRIIKVTEK